MSGRTPGAASQLGSADDNVSVWIGNNPYTRDELVAEPDSARLSSEVNSWLLL